MDKKSGVGPSAASDQTTTFPEMETWITARELAVLERFESHLTEDDLDAFPTWQAARFVQDQIHDQFRQF